MIEKLCTTRKLYAYGALRDHFVEKNLIGFVRLGDEKHPSSGCAVVMCNLPERFVVVITIFPGRCTDDSFHSERPKDAGITMNVGAVSFPIERASSRTDHLRQANEGSWKNLLDSSASVSVGSNGDGRFTCSGQVAVWVKSA
jgi:hypothetical protein